MFILMRDSGYAWTFASPKIYKTFKEASKELTKYGNDVKIIHKNFAHIYLENDDNVVIMNKRIEQIEDDDIYA